MASPAIALAPASALLAMEEGPVPGDRGAVGEIYVMLAIVILEQKGQAGPAVLEVLV
jgi:hypothetical protein